MPLLDHFRPPLSRTHPWRGFHGAWAAAMARLLNQGVLPPGYYAVPFLDRAGPIEIYVAALAEAAAGAPVARWTPPPPAETLAVEWPSGDDTLVEIRADDGDPRLAAAVELVSPRNKDGPLARAAFAAKCAEHLRHGRGLAIVDVVGPRRVDLHAELLAALGAAPSPGPEGMSAISYLAVNAAVQGQLQSWPEPLEIGRPLPTLPLWLGADLAVPLDLEASHQAACADLRNRDAA